MTRTFFRPYSIRRFAIVFLVVCSVFAGDACSQRDGDLQRRIDSTIREYCVIESASQVEIRVPMSSTILWLADDGMVVRKGDRLAQLDTAALREKLNEQKIVYATVQANTSAAKTKYEISRRRQAVAISAAAKSLDASKLALNNFSGDNGTAKSQVIVAELELAAAEEKLKFLTALRNQGTNMVALQIIDAKLAIDLVKQNLKQLKDRDHPQQKAELESVVAKREAELEMLKLDMDLEVAAADAHLRGETSKLKIEKDRLEILQNQLEKCNIQSPMNGRLMMAKAGRSTIEEGAAVRERQTIATIIDDKNYQARVLVNESRIGKVKTGQPVKIAVAALSGEPMVGVVSSVSRFPEPVTFLGSDIKKYAVVVKLTKPSDKLRHGMTAQAEITIK